MKLSQAIRTGSLSHKQTSMLLYCPAMNGTCALGAAYFATFDQIPDARIKHTNEYYKELVAKHPILNQCVERTRNLKMEYTDAVIKQRLITQIMQMNDCGYTRETIADWVETLETKWTTEDTMKVIDKIVAGASKMIIANPKISEFSV